MSRKRKPANAPAVQARAERSRAKIKKTAAKANVPEVQLETIVGEVLVEEAGKRRAVKKLIREPMLERGHWDDPTDQNTRSKTARQQHGFRRADPVRTLNKTSPQKVTERHVRVCDRLRDDYEMSQGATAGDGIPGAGGAASTGGPTEAAIIASQSFRRAMQRLGHPGDRAARIVWHVVLEGQTLKSFAEKPAHRVTQEEAKGVLISALDALARHYEPRVRRAPPPDEPCIRGSSITTPRPEVNKA